MGANQSSWTGLFYKASEFAWANFVHLEEFVFLFIKASACECRASVVSGWNRFVDLTHFFWYWVSGSVRIFRIQIL